MPTNTVSKELLELVDRANAVQNEFAVVVVDRDKLAELAELKVEEPSLNEEELAQLQSVLGQLDEVGNRIVQSLDRIHILVQDMVKESRTAREAQG